MCIGIVLMPIWDRIWISIVLEIRIRIQIGIKTTPINNTGILASKKKIVIFEAVLRIRIRDPVPF
jgi:hypothetical protein